MQILKEVDYYIGCCKPACEEYVQFEYSTLEEGHF